MTEAPLLDLIETNRRYELEDWWAQFLADCAARAERRPSFQSRANKGVETRRAHDRAWLREFAR